MKGQIALIMFVGISVTAHGETIGGSFMFGGGDPAPSVPPAPRAVAPAPQPVRAAEIVTSPLPPPKPTMPAPSASVAPTSTPPPVTGQVPFQASLNIGSTRCPNPIAHPNARNTPVKVYVDQQTQTVRIITPDRPEPVESRVSTGGGLKIPNGRIKKAPYCARTPAKDRLIISAVKPEMFKGTGCTEDEIRAKSTVFPMYHTRTFTDKNGREVPMPNAVRIVDGIFFHEVPPSYREMLGHNVSGECVRLAPSIAKFLRAQTEKYGAIEVTLSAPPVVGRQMPQYCDERMVADASGRQTSPTAAPQSTGTEGVYGGEDNFFTMIGRIFNPHPYQAPRPAQPVRRG